jgi:transposase
LLHDKPVRGLRQVDDIASTTDQENRRLTTLRKDAGGDLTRVINKIKRHSTRARTPGRR